MQLIRFTECLQLPILRIFQCSKGKLKSQYRKSLLLRSEWSSVTWALPAALWGPFLPKTVPSAQSHLP